MASSVVQVVGLPKILQKLDKGLNIGPESKVLLQDAGAFVKKTWVERMPADWNRPRQVSFVSTEVEAVVSSPRYPYVFFERGSQYPVGTTVDEFGTIRGRSHRRRRGVRVNQLRIRPRRYIARAKAKLRRELPKMLDQMAKAVEEGWGL